MKRMGLALLVATSLMVSGQAAPPTRDDVLQTILPTSERFLATPGPPSPGLGIRSVFAHALVLTEARREPERVTRLIGLMEACQDREVGSPSYGNFRWYWRDTNITDYNAVDFCLLHGSLLWIRNRDALTPADQQRLRTVLEAGLAAGVKHKMKPSYSNIAVMNAGNLILLGEALDQPTATAEGYARLDAVRDDVRKHGIHEFVSPTYAGITLDALLPAHAYAREERGRATARQLLEYLWTDLAANWFAPAERYAGAHSRSYDYLYGRGIIATHLILNGWMSGPLSKSPDVLVPAIAPWSPPRQLRDLAARYPRYVRQSWGDKWFESRTHYLCSNITLSSSSVSYGGRTDMPLTIDLPGTGNSPRGYFIADGRGDPCGQKRILEKVHNKALHLNPFWAAAQDRENALGLVVYRTNDITTECDRLESNLVLPLDGATFTLDGKPLTFDHVPQRLPVPLNTVLTLQRGTAAVAIRVLWTRGCDGAPAPVFLVHDTNANRVVRLVVEHAATGAKPVLTSPEPGAAFQVRITSALPDAPAFDAWLTAFVKDGVEVTAGPADIRLRSTIEVEAASPWKVPTRLSPLPTRGLIEMDGEDIGAPLVAKER